MATIDKDLAAALKQAKSKSMHFALVERKPGEGTLIVSKNPVPQSAIAEAQKDLGGGKIFKGTCATDAKTGELIFETTGDVPNVNTLKAVIKLDAGLSLKIDARKAKPPVTIKDVLGAMDDDRKQQVEKRLSDITGGSAYKKAIALGEPVAGVLKKQVDKVKNLIGLKKYDNAEAALDELKKLADQPTEDM